MGKPVKTPYTAVAEIMRAMESIVSDDVSRPSLATVQVRREGAAARVTATDGHCLVTALFRDEAIVRALTDGMSADEAYVRPLEARQRAVAGVSIPWSSLETPFPAWEEVIPVVDGQGNGARAVGMDPDLFATVLVAVRKLMTAAGAGRKGQGVVICVGDDDLSPVTVKARTHELEVTAVVMPMRV